MTSITALPRGILPPTATGEFVDKTGKLSNAGLNILQQFQSLVNGLAPTIACNEDFVANKYILTPVSISPQVKDYYSYWSFAFVASDNSTGAVTATVVPRTGVLDTLKVYKDNGASQAGNGDIIADLFYVLYYVDALDSGNGGFVLK